MSIAQLLRWLTWWRKPAPEPNNVEADVTPPDVADNSTPKPKGIPDMSYFPQPISFRAGTLPAGLCTKAPVPAAYDTEGRWWIDLEAYLMANAERLLDCSLTQIITQCPTRFLTKDGTESLFVLADRRLETLARVSFYGFTVGPDEEAAAKKREFNRIMSAFRSTEEQRCANIVHSRNTLIGRAVQPVLDDLEAELEAQGHTVRVEYRGSNMAALTFTPAGLSTHDLLNRFTVPRVEFRAQGEVVTVTTRGLSHDTVRRKTAAHDYPLASFTSDTARAAVRLPIEQALKDLEGRQSLGARMC